jgi:membrane protein
MKPHGKPPGRLPGVTSAVRRLARRIISIGHNAWNRSMEERVLDGAAVAAYYSLFSLFPLLLLAVVVGSYFLNSDYVMQRMLDAVSAVIPSASKNLIRTNLMQILDHRGSVGAMGLVGLLWGASGAFLAIQDNLTRAWPREKPRGIWGAQLFAFVMITAFFFLLILFSITRAAAGIVYTWLSRRIAVPNVLDYISSFAFYGFIFFAFFVLYRWVPKAGVRWPEALAAALFATVVSQLFTSGFGWFLKSGLNRYNLVYGPLGTLIAFMFWLFIMNLVLFAGGYLSAAIARELRPPDKLSARP